MDKKLKRKLEVYKNYTFGQIVLEALKQKGNLRRDQDLEIIREAEKDTNLVFKCNDRYFRNVIKKSLSKLFAIPQIDITNINIDKDVASIIPKDTLTKQNFLPISKSRNKLTLAIADPKVINTIDKLPQINGYNTQFVICDRLDISKTIVSTFSDTDKTKKTGGEGPNTLENNEDIGSGDIEEISASLESGKEIIVLNNLSPTAIIDTIFKRAMKIRATDIHLESTSHNMKVRYRVDGMLFEYFRIPDNLISPTTSRIKVLSNLDITESRLPQDGRITTNIDGKEYHLRVATLPTKRGEDVVFRILREGNIFEGVAHLGIDKEDQDLIMAIINRPHGMVLVTGPIGSGKTTTLYTALNELDISKKKVVTIEDPVECLLNGISQVEVDSKIDVNFVNSLRSILRHDANILMVGEIRDIETAKIAIRASLTGQLLFSTLHAVDTASAITTLQNFDVPPYLIASALNGLIAQRLVRKICEHCKEKYVPNEKVLQQLGIDNKEGKEIKFAYGQGCIKCNGVGYYGRTAVFEILQITDTIKDAIINQISENELRKLTCKEGLKTLRDRGVSKIIERMTTPDEVMREIFLTGGKV